MLAKFPSRNRMRHCFAFSGHVISMHPRLRSRPVQLACATLAGALTVLLINNFWQAERRIDKLPRKEYGVRDPQFIQVMSTLLGPSVARGNSVRALINGDQIFPAMLAAIRGAKRSVTFETYIYWSGDIGQTFADALSERARAGVPVHVLIDWVGSAKMDDKLLAQMRDAGVEIRKFHKPAWNSMSRLNNRTHRKLLVVDGAIGFTGGVGIAEKWTGNAQDADHWRDSHYEVRGPAVTQIQATFMQNWLKVTGEPLHSEAYFPNVQPQGGIAAQMFSSSPESGADNMELMYHLLIAAADRSIDLSMAYFVPDELSSDAIVAALRRGVKVRIIVPGPITDTETVRSASRRVWGPLLEAGAEIYEYQPTMYHCKVMIVDDYLVSVGSTNFDSRSFRLNDEANLNIYDEAFAREQTALFIQDLAKSRRVTFADWVNRPLSERIREWPGLILHSQL